MHFIGELRDENKAKEIILDLQKKGIEAKLQYLKQDDLWAIYTLEANQQAQAHELYRVKLGLKKPIEIAPEWIELKKIPMGFFTKIFIFISVVLFFVSYTRFGDDLYAQLMFSQPGEEVFFKSLKNWEFYRLITPVFLHMNVLHILFNMLWFKDLSSLLEDKFSLKLFFVLFFFSAVISNLLQYLVQGPKFGGMSGVLYALLGFFWIYKKSHNNFDFGIPDRDMKIMLFWFILCLTGLLGPIANLAHAGGLSFGMIMALVVERSSLNYNWLQQAKIILFALIILLATIFIEGFKLKANWYFNKNLTEANLVSLIK